MKRKEKRLQLNSSKTIFALILILGFSAGPNYHPAYAQSTCTNQTEGKSKTELETDLEACNREIAEAEALKKKYENDSASFSRDILVLTAKIKIAQANIKGKNIAVTNLTKDIVKKQAQISVLDNRLNQGKQALASIIRKTNHIGSYSLVEAVLSDKSLSEFFVDIDTYASTELALANLSTELKTVKTITEAEKITLNKKREAEAAARASLEASKKVEEANQKEKKILLTVSRNNEKTYAEVVADRKAKAAQIRAVLFPLRDAGPIPFGTALAYAQTASAQTGVRAAFILGIFATESGKGSDGTFGGNVGQCLLTNIPNKGDGKGKNTGKFFSQVMKGSRDVDPFLEITSKLGLDPYSQPVSCPQSIGYGGAMGPAQFIPSSWKIMEAKISKALNKTVPNPWNPADAFMAAALYLADLGAAKGTYEAERVAACRYNGGGTACTSITSGYGTTALKNAAKIQTDIDFLQSL